MLFNNSSLKSEHFIKKSTFCLDFLLHCQIAPLNLVFKGFYDNNRIFVSIDTEHIFYYNR